MASATDFVFYPDYRTMVKDDISVTVVVFFQSYDSNKNRNYSMLLSKVKSVNKGVNQAQKTSHKHNNKDLSRLR